MASQISTRVDMAIDSVDRSHFRSRALAHRMRQGAAHHDCCRPTQAPALPLMKLAVPCLALPCRAVPFLALIRATSCSAYQNCCGMTYISSESARLLEPER